jgi:hypothetical protein
MMISKLRLTGRQHCLLKAHLFPGDGNEAVAVALCGRSSHAGSHLLSVHRLECIPYTECVIRTPDRITWATERIEPLIEEAAHKGMAVVKIHSHPGGYPDFSLVDDRSDRELFASVYGITDTPLPHASAVMLPDGSLFARSIGIEGEFTPIPLVAVAGDNIHFWTAGKEETDTGPLAFSAKNQQFFGEETFRRLRQLSIAVVGCSGTGSPTIEQLARLGVGRLVLVDPDVVKTKNLNRILNTRSRDATGERFKVDVLDEAIQAMEIGTEVVPLARTLMEPDVLQEVAACDVIFGCMDSAEGRYYLNRLAAFHSVPYFDLGVRLDADGSGGVDGVYGSVHYLQPDGSSLLSRGVITMEEVRAEGMARESPEEYQRQRSEGYIRNVEVERPAVISINMLISAMAVNEFIARLHPYRLIDSRAFAIRSVDLINDDYLREDDGMPCLSLTRYAGRGQIEPPLGLPSLSKQESGQ